MYCTFEHAALESVTATVSKEIVPVTKHLEGLASERKALRLQKGTGIESLSLARPELCTSDLAMESIHRMIENGAVTREQVGALLFISQTADYLTPSTSHVMQGKLGLGGDVIAMDIELGCSGFVYGLYLAAALLPTLAPGKKVLLCGGDTSSRNADPTETAMRSIAGDAAFAAVIGIPTPRQSSKMYFHITTDGSKADYLLVARGGSRANRLTDTEGQLTTDKGNFVQMNGMGVMDYTLYDVPKNIQELLSFAKKQPSEVELAVLHQANQMTVTTMAEKLGIAKERVPFRAQRYGNTSSASIPLCISELSEPLPEHGLLLSGFGVGMSTASVYMDGMQTNVLKTGTL
ncbi:MAG: 3-oxoacyl-[acyl-carrier-protein] synthase III C-terminal domain-containing protein [Selenomonadaceae bacterium]|nr:3-oxoacyl-[acyl-carrier-protein] synthase III C-terminal domain-containing protein [Selenomonadaceae bacterium]